MRFLILLGASFTALAGSNSPNEFSQAHAMAHVRFLAALKSRTAGTSGESRAIRMFRHGFRPRSWTLSMNLDIKLTRAGVQARTTGLSRRLVLSRLT